MGIFTRMKEFAWWKERERHGQNPQRRCEWSLSPQGRLMSPISRSLTRWAGLDMDHSQASLFIPSVVPLTLSGPVCLRQCRQIIFLRCSFDISLCDNDCDAHRAYNLGSYCTHLLSATMLNLAHLARSLFLTFLIFSSHCSKKALVPNLNILTTIVDQTAFEL